MAESNLILFDVDGTLVDSQSQIIDAMQKAFLAIDHPLPTHQEILSIV
ncbi:MAG: HAD hydrolase-like protein, partial [Paracoccaceae bacterium]|nr:HAD hydrolase-like protein [Paracoccaceae bacterium]